MSAAVYEGADKHGHGGYHGVPFLTRNMDVMPMMKRHRLSFSFACAFLCCMHTIQGLAYEVKEKSLSEKVEVSSLVFVGTITDPNYRPLSVGSHERVALVRVDKVLKESASSTVQVRYATGSPESDLACCKVGERYLFWRASTAALAPTGSIMRLLHPCNNFKSFSSPWCVGPLPG